MSGTRCRRRSFFMQLGKQIFATSGGTRTTRSGRRRDSTSDRAWHLLIRRCNRKRWFFGWILCWKITICIIVGNMYWTGDVFGSSLRPVAPITCSVYCGPWRWQSRRGCGTSVATVKTGLFESFVFAMPGSIGACISVACCTISFCLFFNYWSCHPNTNCIGSGLPKKGWSRSSSMSARRMTWAMRSIASVNPLWCWQKSKP